MTDFKTLVDSEMTRILEAGPDVKDPNIKKFYDALLSNDGFKNGITNTMSQIAQKFAGIMMTGVRNEEDMKELVCTLPVARPLLGMIYMGYLIGEKAGEVKKMEEMFGSAAEAN